MPVSPFIFGASIFPIFKVINNSTTVIDTVDFYLNEVELKESKVKELKPDYSKQTSIVTTNLTSEDYGLAISINGNLENKKNILTKFNKSLVKTFVINILSVDEYDFEFSIKEEE